MEGASEKFGTAGRADAFEGTKGTENTTCTVAENGKVGGLQRTLTEKKGARHCNMVRGAERKGEKRGAWRDQWFWRRRWQGGGGASGSRGGGSGARRKRTGGFLAKEGDSRVNGGGDENLKDHYSRSKKKSGPPRRG